MGPLKGSQKFGMHPPIGIDSSIVREREMGTFCQGRLHERRMEFHLEAELSFG